LTSGPFFCNIKLRNITKEIGVENELFDQVVVGIKKKNGVADDEDSIALEIGMKIKDMFKGIAVENLRLN